LTATRQVKLKPAAQSRNQFARPLTPSLSPLSSQPSCLTLDQTKLDARLFQVVEETATTLRHFGFEFDQRGLVSVKGKGKLMTFYLTGRRQLQQCEQPERHQQHQQPGGESALNSQSLVGANPLAKETVGQTSCSEAQNENKTPTPTASPTSQTAPASWHQESQRTQSPTQHQQPSRTSNTNDRRMFIMSARQDLVGSDSNASIHLV